MKKFFILGFIVLAGCNADFSGKKTDSLSEKLSMMDREMRTQNGKLEVLEHENKKLRQDMEVLKFDVEARLKAFENIEPTETTNPVLEEKTESDQLYGEPTKLN
ncbi:MAG: hypothetical protein ACTSXL_01830 [Alphaproteobacteria bacterium]|nr:MAG: hypothetical protein B6I23_03065 [Rickettsiaceae bacterium 4572_127]